MVVNSLGIVLTILVITIQVYAWYKISRYQKEIDEKNMQLMQFYLDSRFINKSLVDSLKASHSINFCKDLIERIKDYYHLEEIVIIDSVTKIAEVNKNLSKDTSIAFTKEDIKPILNQLIRHEIKEFKMMSGGKDYILHISKLSTTAKSDGVIICIESTPSLLNKHEKLGLENALNLLKNRLFYD
ncbi:MAG: hypothetical protein NWS20_05585 [Rickettsiaceae bacterium]|nr:hypothetical protein [Rickettsiaceae bacterium]MDP4832718.1 hypothetical protein [Rickettsiaceae bacterium]MDP5021142.1 hypothetical protein [Rickettsiaceae bacterium]